MKFSSQPPCYSVIPAIFTEKRNDFDKLTPQVAVAIRAIPAIPPAEATELPPGCYSITKSSRAVFDDIRLKAKPFLEKNSRIAETAAPPTENSKIQKVPGRQPRLADIPKVPKAGTPHPVECWTPSGQRMIVTASSAEHAEVLRRMNPEPKGPLPASRPPVGPIEVPAGLETPQFMTQEELEFLHCHEPSFLRKVRQAFVQQRLADCPDHYREWFIDELSDPDTVILIIGLQHLGIADKPIARAVYDRDRVLACLSHFQEKEPDDQKTRLLDVLKIPFYELRKPLPVATAATFATYNQPEDQKIARQEPEFILQSVTVEAGDSAGNTLAKLGYQVRYLHLRDPQTAQKALTAVLNAGHRLLGLDIETMPKPAYVTHLKAGLDPLRADIRLAQVATPDGVVLVFDHLHLPTGLLELLMKQSWTAHNAGFEWRFLKTAGLSPQAPHCTLLMSRVVTGMPLSLAEASRQALSIDVGKELQISNWRQAELSPAQVNYAALDAVLTLRLAKHYADPINATRQATVYRLFQEAIPVVAQQMLDGVPFDVDGHRRQMDNWMAELEPLQEELRRRLGGINPDSGQQLAEWLRQNLDQSTLAKWPTTEKGQLKTDLDAFQSVPDLLMIEPLRRYKLLRKRLSTFGDGYAKHLHPVTGRLHADFQIAGTRGGRFRCTHPNLQNPPRDNAFRSLFAAPEGYRLVVADYSQVELRIAALIAQDKTMLEAYEAGQDLHRKTAAAVAGITMEEVTKAQRQMAKAINFGLIYGMGAAGLAAYARSSYGVAMTLPQATAARETFFKTYLGILLWHTRTKARGRVDPTVRTQSGLIRDFRRETEFKLTEALNTPVQGSGAECLLRSLALLPKRLAGLDAKLIHHVHDEILLEVAERDVEAVKQALTEAMTEGFLTVFPGAHGCDLVEAHDGKNWAEAK